MRHMRRPAVPTTAMLNLARAIEARASPGLIATRWRGKRLVVTGAETAKGPARIVYLELKVHGEMGDFEVRSKVGKHWRRLAKAVMYQGIVASGPARLALWCRECAAGGLWDGAPGPATGVIDLPVW